MKNIITILSEMGIEIPEDKQNDLTKAVAENYKTQAEIEKKYGKLESERDTWKERAEKAEETLTNLGDEPEKLKEALATAQQELKDAQAKYTADLADREFDSLIKDAIAEAKGKNVKAIKALLNVDELKASKNQKEDLTSALNALKESDDSSFLFTNEQQQAANNNAARFTSGKKAGSGNGNGTVTKDDIMKIKDATERQAAIAEHADLFAPAE